uniref:Uncharacterized protein n=1 Tax=Octopus bimaculoides TaxID=37653 RepID=A0A0L8G6S2_OCTBM
MHTNTHTCIHTHTQPPTQINKTRQNKINIVQYLNSNHDEAVRLVAEIACWLVETTEEDCHIGTDQRGKKKNPRLEMYRTFVQIV